jgi:hypothetical protein
MDVHVVNHVHPTGINLHSPRNCVFPIETRWPVAAKKISGEIENMLPVAKSADDGRMETRIG